MESPQTGQVSTSDLYLMPALDEAILKSPRASAIRSLLPIAKSGYLQATVMPNPSFIYLQNFKADQVKEVGASIPVEPPWKLAFRLLAAKRQITQTDLEIVQNLWTLRADVRRAYLDLIIAQEMSALETELAGIFRQFLDAAQEKYKSGAVPQIEVEKARLATQQAEIEVERQAQRVILARQHLNIIMGRSVDAPLAVPRLHTVIAQSEQSKLLPDFAHDVRPLSEFIAEAMEYRPQLKVIQQTIKTNGANLTTAFGNIAPNPVLTFGHLTANDIGPTNGITKGYWAGVNVDIPVFDVQQGNVARLRATIKQLKCELEAQKNIATDQVAASYRRLLIARQVTRAYQERVLATSKTVVQMTKESYQYGRSDITAALVAAQLNIQTQTQYLTAVSEYQQALTDLEQAVGKPLE
ncbi:MAG: TolC family protein [Cyanobacteria bacterium REEB67]|nr:TolC family protein [Cyanobacteria bacterium REEB67]